MRITNCLALAFVLLVTASGCESDNPIAPDENNGSGTDGGGDGDDGDGDDGDGDDGDGDDGDGDDGDGDDGDGDDGDGDDGDGDDGDGDDGDGDDGDGGGGGGPALSSTNGSIDGEPYQATEIFSPHPDFFADQIDIDIPRLLTVSTGNRETGWLISFAAPFQIGTHRVSASAVGVEGGLTQHPPYETGQLPEPALVFPAWFAVGPLGSGSVTIATLTDTMATGTFSFTLIPVPGTTATGNRTVSGSFSVTFINTIQF